MANIASCPAYNAGITASAEMADRSPKGRQNADELVLLVYDELRRLAGHLLRGDRPNHTLRPTEVVHEAWPRLARLERIQWRGPTHFKAIAAIAMRQVLADYARRKFAKRRPNFGDRVTFTDVVLGHEERTVEVLALEEALVELESENERQVRVVECRVFAGMTVEETADALEISERTVKYDWRFAKAWLRERLSE